MFILASKSPRRKQLLEMVGFHFECIPSDAEEIVPEGMRPSEMPEFLSKLKAHDIKKGHPLDTVIGSDTLVVIDGHQIGKPKSEEEAFRMLKTLSGRTHEVFTGVTICFPDSEESFTSRTEVEFYELSDQEIWDYIKTGDPMDKAGAYGIQGIGAPLVKAVHGDYYTVMGLPVAEVVHRIRRHEK